jgi:drug/metabolite transporter (DMT)-like permease
MKRTALENRISGKGWLVIAISMTILAAPTGTIIRSLCGEIDALTLVFVRYALCALVLLPIAIRECRKYWRVIRKRLLVTILAAFPMSFGASLFAVSIAQSNAVFVAILDMLVPIVFTIISTMVIKDKISKHAFLGLMFAIAGGLLVVVLPAIFEGGGQLTEFGLAPVLFLLAFVVIDAVYPVFLRKTNEQGVPLPFILLISYILVTLTSGIFTLAFNGPETFNGLSQLSTQGWLGILYLVLVVTLASRLLNTKAYEHVGTAVSATVGYLYYVVAIFLPVLTLGEELSIWMIAGSVFIILGVVFARRHKHPHHHSVHHKL